MGKVWTGFGRVFGNICLKFWVNVPQCLGRCSQATGQNEERPADCAQRSAAPPQVAPRAGFKIQVLAKYLQAQVAQLQKPRPRSPDYPLSISPPGHAHSAGPGQKSGKVCFFRFFRRSFGLPQRTSKFASKNHRKKCENHGFWPPKTVPKSIQNASENDVPTNM